jgi:ABC-type sugar transport system ATPase subunit
MNFFTVGLEAVEGNTATVRLPGGRSARVGVKSSTAGVGQAVDLGVRPEHLTIVEAAAPAAAFEGTVGIVERLGNTTLVYVDTPGGQLIVEAKGTLEVKGGDPIGLKLEEPHVLLFGADGAAI